MVLHIVVLFTFVFGKVSQFANMVFEEWFNQQLLVDSRSCAIKLQMFHDGTTTSQHYLTSSQYHHYSGEGGCYTDPQPCGSGGVAGECSPIYI